MERNMFRKFLNRLTGKRGPQDNGGIGWQEQYEAIFSTLPVGITFLTPEMRFIRINPFLESKLGLRSEDVKGRYCYDVVGTYKDDPVRSGEARICEGCGVQKTIATGLPQRHSRKIGDGLYMENYSAPVKSGDGKVIGVIEIITDVTERVKLEERLQGYAADLEKVVEEKTREIRKSKKFLNNIIESVADAIITLDNEGRLCYFNMAVAGVFGHPGNTLPGKRLTELLAPPYAGVVESAFKDAGETGDGVHNLSVSVLAADGSERNLLMSIAPLSDSDPKSRFVVVCRDVTSENKLAREKEEFVTMLSHDLKNPLTSIIGYSHYLLSGELGKLEGETKSAVQSIKANCDTLMALVKNFLSAGKIDEKMLSMDLRPIKVEPLIMDSLSAMQPQIRNKGIVVEASVAPNLPRAIADRDQLERVFSNLLSNAVKFTPQGGRITIKTYNPGDGYIAMEVSDTGAGISENELPMLFEKYFQCKDSGVTGGSGLGLYIAKNIVEAHQGRISVESMPGKGTTFTVRLPLIV